jgi:hypothetical protein
MQGSNFMTRWWDKEGAMANLKEHIWTLVRGQLAMLSYEHMYRNQYNLVAHGYGREVYWFLRSTLDSMSLCMRKDAYYGAVELIYKVSLHLDNRWCAVKQLPGLIESAAVAYDRPVARRWRRALVMARWEARLRKWRAAFNEAWLRPGGVGERQLAKRFEDYAHAHQDPVCLHH